MKKNDLFTTQISIEVQRKYLSTRTYYLKKYDILLKVLNFQNSSMQQTDKWIILELIKQEQNEHWTELADIKKDIKLLKSKQEKLLDMKLDEIIDEKTYLLKYNLFEGQIKDFLEQKIRLKRQFYSQNPNIVRTSTKPV